MDNEISVLSAVAQIPLWLKLTAAAHVAGILFCLYVLGEPIFRLW